MKRKSSSPCKYNVYINIYGHKKKTTSIHHRKTIWPREFGFVTDDRERMGKGNALKFWAIDPFKAVKLIIEMEQYPWKCQNIHMCWRRNYLQQLFQIHGIRVCVTRARKNRSKTWNVDKYSSCIIWSLLNKCKLIHDKLSF